MIIAIIVTMVPVDTQAATAKARRIYAGEVMKAWGTDDCLIIVPGTKYKDGSRQAKVYHYYYNCGKAHLRKSWNALIGRKVKWSKTSAYAIGHGKNRVDLKYEMGVDGISNKAKQRYFMMAEGAFEVSAYVQYKVADNSFKYKEKWQEDRTGTRNIVNIGMPFKWAKYVWELGTGLPVAFM